MTTARWKWTIAACLTVGLLAGTAAAVAASRGTGPPAGVSMRSDSSVATLQQDLAERGITYQAATPGTAIVPSVEAVRATIGSFSAVLDGSPAKVEHVLFTDANYGVERAEGDQPSDIEPFYVDRAVWMVVLENQKVPIMGPMNAPEAPEYYESTFVAFVDSRTGEVLRAVAY